MSYNPYSDKFRKEEKEEKEEKEKKPKEEKTIEQLELQLRNMRYFLRLNEIMNEYKLKRCQRTREDIRDLEKQTKEIKEWLFGWLDLEK